MFSSLTNILPTLGFFTVFPPAYKVIPTYFQIVRALSSLRPLFKRMPKAWKREWQPTPVFLPGEFHGQRSLEGYSPCGHTESDTTEWLIHTHRGPSKSSVHACTLSHVSRVRLFATLWTVAPQAPLSMRFSRQESWSGSPRPPPRDLPNTRIEPASPASLELQADSLPIEEELSW